MLGAVLACVPTPASAQSIYLANDDHTDYGWNATTDAYEAAMLSELDFYLGRVAATAADPPDEQARFAADCWYYLWLYQHHRSPQQFQALIDAIASGHITVPLNPFVTLYGSLPTEAAIRAGYYPGQLERRYPIAFTLAQQIEDQTNPWGIASLWVGSGARYSWKGICACRSDAPYQQHQTDVFRWQGPDGNDLLMKWYTFADNRSYGGYAEALMNLSPTAMQAAHDRFSAGGLPTGLFGYGWDEVGLETDAIVDAVRSWNDGHPNGPRAVVSNIVDYFGDVATQRDDLPVLRGGWGNEWDLWPATLADRTARLRRAVEQVRTGEALAAIAYADGNTALWDSERDALADAWLDYFKYFEHSWADGGVGLPYLIGNKAKWEEHFVAAVQEFDGVAADAFAASFATPDENRFVVFNPLAFPRTEYADLPIDGAGPFTVTDVDSGAVVPSQVIERDGARSLRILARSVPSLGYRVFRYVPGGVAGAGCCTVLPAMRSIESDRYRIIAGVQGQLTSVIDKTTGDQQLAAAAGLNVFGGGTVGMATAENVGPVSATLRLDIAGSPPRRVRITLARELDRVEVEDEILAGVNGPAHYRFAFNLTDPQIRCEEVGAIARPGLAQQNGDFLPGTRADYMTLNHFVDLADELGGYHVTLSSRDAFAVRIGNSTPSAFDLPTAQVAVLALGNVAQGDIQDQGGATAFRHDFAIQGTAGPFSAAAAKRVGLAHQNPLRAIPLAHNQGGTRTAPVASFLSVDAPNVVVTALKPAEDGARGLLVRLWELDGHDTDVVIDAAALHAIGAHATSLIETDRGALPLDSGRLHVGVEASRVRAFRFDVGSATPTPTASRTPSAAPPSATNSASATPTATRTSPQATGSSTMTLTATRTAPPTFSATTTATITPAPPSSTPMATRTRTPTPLLTPIPGDLNGDARVTIDDLSALFTALFDPEPALVADVNRDDRITAPDASALLQRIER
jgi:alpha-mannosidase